MRYPVIFPQPRQLDLTDGEVVLGRSGEAIGIDLSVESPLATQAFAALKSALEGAGFKARAALGEDVPIAFEIADAESSDEQYEIKVDEPGVRVAANSPVAALRAAHTLRQIMEARDGELRVQRLTIRDWPEVKWRGMYLESTESAARMEFEHWQGLVDTMASLKLNLLIVGLYSCWRRGKKDAEYFMFPSKTYPRLRTPNRARYYSAVQGKVVDKEELPRIVEGDFLGRLFEYALERGVRCAPLVSCLGHNPHVPHMFPEISMVDAQGNPKHYGFCTSSPKSYEILFGVLDEIIDRYMKPLGLDMFHIGMDEVREICECPKCREMPNIGEDNFVTRHIIKVAEHLKSKGMRRVIACHDMLERGGLLNEKLVALMKEKGVEDVMTIGWWAYNDLRGEPELSALNSTRFRTLRPQLGLHNWCSPSAEWNYRMPVVHALEDRIASCQTHGQLAQKDGAEAMYSYSSHDPLFLEGYHALAEYSWNPTGTNDVRQFKERVCQRIFGPHWVSGMRARQWMIEGYAPWKGIFKNMFRSSLPKEEIGQFILIVAFTKELCTRTAYLNSISSLERAEEEFLRLAEERPAYRDLILMYASDCDWVAAVLNVSLATLETQRSYHCARTELHNEALRGAFEQCFTEVERARVRLGEAMATVERTRHPATAPSVLQMLTGLYEFAEDFVALSKRMLGELKKGDAGTIPLYSDDLLTLRGEQVGIQPLGD